MALVYHREPSDGGQSLRRSPKSDPTTLTAFVALRLLWLEIFSSSTPPNRLFRNLQTVAIDEEQK
jgi:hypothetical protein